MISRIETPSSSNAVNIALDTIKIGKQALVFVNTKRSAEKCAEDIAKKVQGVAYKTLSDKILGVLSKPTKQCKREARCVTKGIAFHHAGLANKQKEIIEEQFRQGKIKVICCTPTLAAGLNLPAFRAIVRDLKRYAGRFGMKNIPVLEYLQMAGRAGRPGYDTFGEAIIIASSDAAAEEIYEQYVCGEPEDIHSKLNVEPVMRTYLLSLISGRIIQTYPQILDFFKDTFWAHQYGDMDKLEQTIEKTLAVLMKWEFLSLSDDKYRATVIGKRIAELYLDPLTAHHLIKGIKRAPTMQLRPVSFIQLICHTNEMWPLLNVKSQEYNDVQEKVVTWETHLLDREPSMFDIEYDDWLKSIKTSAFFLDWIDENTEDFILEKYNVRPGELRGKLQKAEWLLYGMSEMSVLLDQHDLVKEIGKVRFRLRNGVKEELLTLLRLKGVGRVRARRLYNAGVKKTTDIKRMDKTKLRTLLGPKLTANVLEQLGYENDKDRGRLTNYT
jgi:helicase